MKCLHGMDDRFCTICRPLPKKIKPVAKAKPPKRDSREARATEEFDGFSEANAEMLADNIAFRDEESGCVWWLPVNDTRERICAAELKMGAIAYTTASRLAWVMAGMPALVEGQNVEHTCKERAKAADGRRYTCINVGHMRPAKKDLDTDPEPCQNVPHALLANHVGLDAGTPEAEAVLPVRH